MRKWAYPDESLPKEGQQPPFPREWEVAQSALRYLGWIKDQPSWGVLEKGSTRRDQKIDITMDSMMGGGLAILGMTLRAIDVGAADGFAQWGDPKAYPILIKFIEDQHGERAVAHRGVLRAAVGRDRRQHERDRQEGARSTRAKSRRSSSSAAATSRRSCTARCPARARASST